MRNNYRIIFRGNQLEIRYIRKREGTALTCDNCMTLSSPTCNGDARSSSESLLLPLSFPFVVSSNSRPKNASCKITRHKMDQMMRHRNVNNCTLRSARETRSVKTSEGAVDHSVALRNRLWTRSQQISHFRHTNLAPSSAVAPNCVKTGTNSCSIQVFIINQYFQNCLTIFSKSQILHKLVFFMISLPKAALDIPSFITPLGTLWLTTIGANTDAGVGAFRSTTRDRDYRPCSQDHRPDTSAPEPSLRLQEPLFY
jgi:hypothetical protein